MDWAGTDSREPFAGWKPALLDLGGAEVGDEGLGDLDGAVGLLVLLEDGDEEAGEGGAAAVEGVAEDVFAVAVLEAELHAAGLVVAEAGAAGDLEVFVLAGGPDFDVVGFGGAEAEVAGTELDEAVVEAEFLKNGLGMAGEFLEEVEGFVGMGDLDELDLVELVHADDALVVTTGAACFAAETGGVGSHFDGKLVLGEDGFPVEVGDGDLGGGSEEELAVVGAIHVIFELRQLGGAEHALAFDEERDVDLFVAVFVALGIEEKLDEGALELGAGTAIDGKAATGDPGTVLEGDEAVSIRQLDVVLWVSDLGFAAPGADLGVGLFVGTDRTGVVWQVGNAEKKFGLSGFSGGARLIERFDLLTDLFHLGFDGRAVFTISAKCTDLFGRLFAL